MNNTTARAQEITRYLRTHNGPHEDQVLDLAEWASHYHGGQTSGLYSFGSTRKLTCNWRMDQADYLREVEGGLKDIGQFDDPEEAKAVLEALKAFFEVACCHWEKAQDEEHDHVLTPSQYVRS